jgi:hypothetical protein
VLGAAVGLRIAQVRVFVRSLRASGYCGDVLMLVSPYQWLLMLWLRRYGVRTRPMIVTRKVTGPIYAARFQKFAACLAAAAPRYDEVMISDVRDVAFQAHPFPRDLTAGCQFYLEGGGKTIGEEPTNLRWMNIFLPPAQVDALRPCRVSCCGVTIGPTAAMTKYLTRLTAYLHALPLRLRRQIGADTVFHNLMVHGTGEAPGRTVENNVHVATLGLELASAYQIAPDGEIRAASGQVPAILHQYDRISTVAAAVAARFS